MGPGRAAAAAECIVRAMFAEPKPARQPEPSLQPATQVRAAVKLRSQTDSIKMLPARQAHVTAQPGRSRSVSDGLASHDPTLAVTARLGRSRPARSSLTSPSSRARRPPADAEAGRVDLAGPGRLGSESGGAGPAGYPRAGRGGRSGISESCRAPGPHSLLPSPPPFPPPTPSLPPSHSLSSS